MIDHLNAAFISAAKSSNSAHVNEVNHALLAADLHRYGLTFEAVEGTYKGVSERSYIVAMPEHDLVDSKEYRAVMQLARRYEQESALFTVNGDAFLEYTDGRRREHLGAIFWISDLTRNAVDRARTDYTRLSDGGYLVIE